MKGNNAHDNIDIEDELIQLNILVFNVDQITVVFSVLTYGRFWNRTCTAMELKKNFIIFFRFCFNGSDFNPFATGDVYMRQFFHCLQW